MPVLNVQGQNSTIEMPMPSNITDAARDTSNRDRLLSTAAPYAPALKHVKEFFEHYWAARQANKTALDEARQAKVEAKAHRDKIVEQHTNTGFKLTPEATAEDDAIIAEAEEEIAKRSKKKFPSGDYDEVKAQAARLRRWLPHDKKYFEGDTRHIDDIRKDAKNVRLAAEAKLDIAIQSPRHSEDAIQSVKAWVRARGDKAKATTSACLQGFTVDHRGEFQINTTARIEIHQEWSGANQHSEDLALVEDGVGFLCSVAPELVEARFNKQILEESDDENAIRDADRPAMIAAAKAELLAAMRKEEAANKMCERAGIPVFRPSGWPIEVLLEVEAPPKTKPVPRAPVVNAALVIKDEAADAPDFEEDAADE